ncbi:2-carboxy-1,4-naphthoquinone phytyltransferase [Gracilariopsis chorda]|uniref:2-carboxy-1,4-naphthoquinone phytyltransferase n=1 Tax=Gracilariopsis chorda TaxID=448386 RepID=A0A2V3J4C4_9FLOR|nr:2-carboxy-1,4-naphthoquinone phytyltransferase [Gracilariopsis chorda]|eukprot:PXF49229.1 2-carboxy-1,4-naphthoquinone phytyltransferase [Gracilariopsis chorda]
MIGVTQSPKGAHQLQSTSDLYPSSSLATPRTNYHLWLAAIKPPMYTVAIAPMTVGAFSAYALNDTLHLPSFLFSTFASVCIIAWLNLTNDAFDFETGVDKNKKESVVNLLGGTNRAKNFVLMLAITLLSIAFALLYLAFRHDTAPLIALFIAVLEGYVYQGPPFRLSYKGLGEFLCFTSWFIATTAMHYSQTPVDTALPLSERLRALFLLPLTSKHVLAPATLVAYPTTLILFSSHFHQIHDDAAVGKRSPIVRLGTLLASRVLAIAVGALCLLQVYFYLSSSLPFLPFVLSAFAFPLAIKLALFVLHYHDKPNFVRAAKYKAVAFHFVHGMLLSLGYWLS